MFPKELQEYDASRIPEGFDVRCGKHGHHWAVYERKLETSENDDRQYRLIRLDNGLEALIVSDKDADKAAAALSVRIGSMHDPPELPGLAHFCEHLLFCGSRKYPNESEYQNFIAKHGGDCNACTTLEYTTYHFSLTEMKQLGAALDRFSSNFIAPLFEASVVDREIKAINSEFERGKNCDGRRMDQIRSSLSKPGHPFANFGIGNLKTLGTTPREKGIQIKEELVKFYKAHYSANLMRLCVVSNQSLNTVTDMVSGLFSDLPFQNRPPTIWPGHPMGAELSGHKLFVKRVRKGDLLHIEFPLEDQTLYFKTAPAEFLASLIGHESQGSLLMYLKDKGWSSALMAGPSASATGWSSFEVSIDLTESGKEHTNDILIALCSYLKMLKREPPSERIFNEYAQLADIQFRFEEKGEAEELVTNAVDNMHEPWERYRILSQPSKSNVYDPDLIRRVLDQLDPMQMAVAYASPDEASTINYDRTEPYYGTKYGLSPIPEDVLGMCCHPPRNSALHLPHINPFVPVGIHKVPKTDVEPQWTADSIPIILKEEDGVRVWFQQDAEFLNPKTAVNIACRSTVVAESARNFIMARLFTDIIEENVNEFSYPAFEAGMCFGFDLDFRGFFLTFGGYTQQIPKLAEIVFEHTANVSVTPETFSRLKYNLRQSQENWSKSNSMAKACFLLARLQSPISFTAQEKLDALDTINAGDVLAFGKAIMRNMFVELYIHGSMSEMGALHFWDEFNKYFSYQAADNVPAISNYMFTAKKNAIIHGRAENEEEVDNAIINCYSIGHSHNRENVMRAALIVDILEQKAFDELRTQQQLGYNVSLSLSTAGQVTSVTFRIESETNPWELDDAIEKFFAEHELELINMDDSDFDQYKSALADNMLESFKYMDDLIGYNWKGIDDGQLGFKLYKADAQRVMAISKEDLIDCYRDFILPRGCQRAKMSVQVQAQRKQADDLEEALEGLLEPYPVNSQSTELQECLEGKPTLRELKAALPKFVADAEAERLEKIYKPFEPKDSSVIILEELKEDTLAEYRQNLEQAPLATPYDDTYASSLTCL